MHQMQLERGTGARRCVCEAGSDLLDQNQDAHAGDKAATNASGNRG